MALSLLDGPADGSSAQTTVAAFGEGSAARLVLVEMLPLDTLLALRGASRSSKILVQDCKLNNVLVVPPPVPLSVEVAGAVRNAFPKVPHLVRSETMWLTIDYSALETSIDLRAVDRDTRVAFAQGISPIAGRRITSLKVTSWEKSVPGSTGGRSFSGICSETALAHLPNLRHLTLYKDRRSNESVFPLSPSLPFPSLVSLELREFEEQGDCTAASIAHLAGQLESLRLYRCNNITDFSSFTKLHTLDVYNWWHTLDMRLLPPALRSLTLYSPLGYDHWEGLARLTQLHTLDTGADRPLDGLADHLPPSVTSLTVRCESYPLSWVSLSAFTNVTRLTIRHESLDEPDDMYNTSLAEQQAVAAGLRRLQSLSIGSTQLLPFFPMSSSLTSLVTRLPWPAFREEGLDYVLLLLQFARAQRALRRLCCTQLSEAESSALVQGMYALLVELHGRQGELRVWLHTGEEDPHGPRSSIQAIRGRAWMLLAADAPPGITGVPTVGGQYSVDLHWTVWCRVDGSIE